MTGPVPASDAATMNAGTAAWQDIPPMKHPGAHLTGVAVLGQMLVADRAWRSMTVRQRQLVANAAGPALATVDVTPPLLDVPARTAASLRAKHLLGGEGRLTTLALLAAHHGPALAERAREDKQRRQERGEAS